VAAVGLALANIALAFVVSTLFSGLDWSQPAKYALGFFITGLGYLVISGIVIVMTRNRLAKLGLVRVGLCMNLRRTRIGSRTNCDERTKENQRWRNRQREK
jgi:hypothetical protein